MAGRIAAGCVSFRVVRTVSRKRFYLVPFYVVPVYEED